MDILKQKLSSRKFLIGVFLILVGLAIIIYTLMTGNTDFINYGITLMVAGAGWSVGSEAVVDAARLIANKTNTNTNVTASSTSSDIVKTLLASLVSSTTANDTATGTTTIEEVDNAK
jgi:hypothetical protein